MKVKVKNTAGRRLRDGSDIEALRVFRQYRAQHGLKYSSKREAIIRYFLNANRHFTVEQLYNEMKKTKPGIGYSTVYRTLKLLTDCGIAAVHHFEEDAARFEPTRSKQHHDHLVCERCGRIIEFTHEGIEQYQHDVARKHGFAVQSRELQLYGICQKCRKKRKGR